MDPSVGLIADYAHGLRFDDLPPAVVHHCQRSIIDTLGCALGAFDAEPSRITRDIARRAQVKSGARLVGTVHRTLPELAAFANGVTARYFDGNDTFPGGGGHPSNTIAAVLAAADFKGVDGRTLITGITLAYEVYYNLFKATDAFDKGIDHAFYTAVAGAVGAAKVLGLGRPQIAEAVSLAITPNIALDTTRYGHLSMWKGCAEANGARNGVFAAVLAAAGMTGPEKPIVGAHGLERWVGEVKLLPFGDKAHPFGINEILLKRFLSVVHAQPVITAALPLSQRVTVAEISKVTMYTYKFAFEVTGKEREKWRPATREAADHSLPYILAAVLIDRDFNDGLFSEERLRDPRIRELIDKIEIVEDLELSRRFPQYMPCRIVVETKSGKREVSETEYPRGHPRNPMTDDEVGEKFRDLAQRSLAPDRVDKVLELLWRLNTAPDLNAIFEAMTIERPGESR